MILLQVNETKEKGGEREGCGFALESSKGDSSALFSVRNQNIAGRRVLRDTSTEYGRRAFARGVHGLPASSRATTEARGAQVALVYGRFFGHGEDSGRVGGVPGSVSLVGGSVGPQGKDAKGRRAHADDRAPGHANRFEARIIWSDEKEVGENDEAGKGIKLRSGRELPARVKEEDSKLRGLGAIPHNGGTDGAISFAVPLHGDEPRLRNRMSLIASLA